MKRYIIMTMILGTLVLPMAAKADPRFRNPMNISISPPISSFYDNNSAAGAVKDWMCGSNTYDRHTGTDFRAPIGSYISAGATGGLYERYDACPTWGYWGNTCGGKYGNYVKIAHTYPYNDSSSWRTIYAHLSQGVSNVRYYSSLSCGAWVGNSGSSGSSTGPHLHFEVKRYGYPSDDPYGGQCSGWTSYWVNQGSGIVPSAQCQ